jgi:NADPH:quinone reductase-like Zn-dependent oxidoreductase
MKLICAMLVCVASTSTPALSQDSSMKAIRIHAFGGVDALKYEDAPKPNPEPDELLVRVKAAGVNPVDAMVRQSGMGGRAKLPFTPGFDVAGVVERVGEKVTKFKPGDEVFAYLALSRGGGYAQFATVKESEAAAKPTNISFDEAGGVPLVALTAWQALVDTAKVDKGQRVLIHGGSGGVGSMAIQIARVKGATVFATASGKNQDLLKALGANTAINYETQKFEEIAKDCDIILDTVGGPTRDRSYACLKKGGILVTIVGQPDKSAAEKHGARATNILVKPDASQLAQIAKLLQDEKIKPAPTQTMPLSDAAKAHEQIATKLTRGKIVLKPE